MTRPCLLLLPGLLCDEAVWSRQQAALVDLDCRVPSYGRLSSITEMADAAIRTAPAGSFSVAGHSMGGRVALEILRIAPERVERLALLDTGVDPIAEGADAARERQHRLDLLDIARTRGMREMGLRWARGMVHPARLETPLFDEVLAMIERKTPDEFEAQIVALLDRPDARATLAHATCPTLLLVGREDTWSPPERHAQMQALLPASTLVVVEECGHMSPMERPEAVSNALRRWMLA